MAGFKGRGSAVGRAAVVAIFVAMALLAVAPAAYAVNHLVGGTTQGWNFASNGYTYDKNWTATQTFVVGDTLEFKYSSGAHDVVELASEADYAACAVSTTIGKWTSGDDSIQLNTTGTRFFVCSYPTHCQGGMKVSVNVLASAAAPAPAPSTTPASPGPKPNAASSGAVLSMAGLLAAALVACLALPV